LHFYTKQRAAEAQQSLRISGHQFACVDLVSHRKEIGINQEPLQTADEDSDEQDMRKRADRYAEDDEGFTVVKKRLI